MAAVPHNLPAGGLGLAALDPDLPEIHVEMEADPLDLPIVDEKGNVIEIEHGDGSVTVSMDGRPIEEAANDSGPGGWYDNLCEKIGDDVLTGLTEDLLLGIADDLESRREWVQDRAQGTKLLGLKIEIPNVQGASDGAPVEGMSRVRHPLLLEAVLRFQANARSEFLPTDGPVKIRNDDSDATSSDDSLATRLEQKMNHYLTAVATEYYPDTDRMLFKTGFGGSGFKKIYECPLRNRPVSESVDADDLIVNQSATDLGNAQRVTQRVLMKASTVKRMQILGVYLNVSLGDPVAPTPDALKEVENEQQGIRPETLRDPKYREREIYECYCELDIPGFEHKDKKGKVTGLPLPYRFTIDVSDRKALAVVRNFEKPEDDDLPIAETTFVKWPFVPGDGFYDIGLMHILGNTTNAVTAAWRLMLDNGMFANFPGFLTAKASSRQNTNIFRIPPGGSAQIETGGMPISQFAMPLPYNTAQMPPLMTLVDNMAETGRRIGGTAEVQVGEGRADVPVGTVMAMIDQAIKVMNAVHKRMHAAQAQELQLLKKLFIKNPDALCKCKSKNPMDRALIIQALNDCDLVPQADPNTSSSGQRMMKIMGLIQLQQASPTLYDPVAINKAALVAMGWSNPQEFMVPPAAQAAPPPQLIQAQAEMKNKATEANAKDRESQAKLITAQAVAHEKTQPTGVAPPEPQDPLAEVTAQAKLMDAHTKAKLADIRGHEVAIEDQNRDLDRQATERDAMVDLARDLLTAPPGNTNVGIKAAKVVKDIGKQP